ncbi:hypothetical protein SLS60_004715 [Paraconiothyrium brasiliense]|uniref:RING-type domain-containing protein n=1 Tax=Paraconiothyrium brasiliense TaxID=300254 RepID=A0ABR3RL47_9PLEO
MNVIEEWSQVKNWFTELLVDACKIDIDIANEVLAETGEELSGLHMQPLAAVEGYEVEVRQEDDGDYLTIAPQGGYDLFVDWLGGIFDARNPFYMAEQSAWEQLPEADDVEPEVAYPQNMTIHDPFPINYWFLPGPDGNNDQTYLAPAANNAEPGEAWARNFVESLEHVGHSEISADDNRCSICWLPFGETDEFHPLYEPPVVPRDPREAEAVLHLQTLPFDLRRPNNDAMMLPCKHIFGRDCIIESFSANSTCPLCRKEMLTYLR